MKEIPLTQGRATLIDDEDYAIVSLFKWRVRKVPYTFYAITNINLNGKATTMRMHRLLLNVKPNENIDHADTNGLNNQKHNLRKYLHSQNHMNQRKTRGTSKYKGVYWNKRAKKWMAQIKLNYKRIYLGLFKNESNAAKAYDEKAKELFKEFAKLNLP